MVPMQMASIGGFNGPRGSLFHGSATDSFRMGSPALGANMVGQERYNEARKQLATFDSLVERAKRIANKQAREDVINTFGLSQPDNKDKALYMRNAVAYDLSNAESYTPINYDIYTSPGPAKSRPAKLKDFNSDFESAVKYAETTYGSLPEPVVIERTTTINQTPGWVLPVTIGAVAIAGLAVFGVFSKK